MISTAHITTGGALGLAVGAALSEPLIALPAAFAVGIVSHHLLDMIPHTDPGSFREPGDKSAITSNEAIFALIDNMLGTGLVLWIFFTREPSWPMLFGAAGGNFPDMLHHVPLWGPRFRTVWKKYFHLHEKLHWTAYSRLIPFGVLSNIIVIWLALAYLLSA